MTATNRPAPNSQGRGDLVEGDCSKGILYGRGAAHREIAQSKLPTTIKGEPKPQNGDCYQFPSLELDSCPRFAPQAATSEGGRMRLSRLLPNDFASRHSVCGKWILLASTFRPGYITCVECAVLFTNEFDR